MMLMLMMTMMVLIRRRRHIRRNLRQSFGYNFVARHDIFNIFIILELFLWPFQRLVFVGDTVSFRHRIVRIEIIRFVVAPDGTRQSQEFGLQRIRGQFGLYFLQLFFDAFDGISRGRDKYRHRDGDRNGDRYRVRSLVHLHGYRKVHGHRDGKEGGR